MLQSGGFDPAHLPGVQKAINEAASEGFDEGDENGGKGEAKAGGSAGEAPAGQWFSFDCGLAGRLRWMNFNPSCTQDCNPSLGCAKPRAAEEEK